MKYKQDIFRRSSLVFTFWLVFPIIVQLIFDQIPILKDWYHFKLVLPFLVGRSSSLQDLLKYSPGILIKLLPPFLVALFLLKQAVHSKTFRRKFLVMSPIVGFILSIFFIYLNKQTSNMALVGTAGFFVAMIYLFAIFYWWFLAALIPVVWALIRPVEKKSSLTKRSLIPGLISVIILGLILSLINKAVL